MMNLEARLGYQFGDSRLLDLALTHPSFVAENRQHKEDNQRLEFLGDAVLQLVLTERLYSSFVNFSEGVLTPMRSRLVSGAALAKIANRLELGAEMRLGRGEQVNEGRSRDKLLADAFEAVLGAVYLDGGLGPATELIDRLFDEEIKQVAQNPLDISPKGQLQICLQALSPEGPSYEVFREEGPDHQRTFHVRVTWQGKELGIGQGFSKKAAEKAAATRALEAKQWDV